MAICCLAAGCWVGLLAACTADERELPGDGGHGEATDLGPATGEDTGDVGGEDGGAPVQDSGSHPPPPCTCPDGACVRRESDEAEICARPCRAGTCAAGLVCLRFPPQELCLPSGSTPQGTYCRTGSDCAGGLCIYTGGRSRFCTRECAGPADATCGAGWSCLPSLTPQGSWHCYRTGDVETGGSCREEDPWVCRGGYCLGAGLTAYCSEQCDPAQPAACPTDWPCEEMGDGHVCRSAY